MRSSTVNPSSDSRKMGASVNRSRRIRLSSLADTGRQAFSSNGFCIMMRFFCSRWVCSTPRQCSHKEDKPRPAILRSTLHYRHRAYPSTIRLCRGKPTKVPTTPDTEYEGFRVFTFFVRAVTEKHPIYKNTQKKQHKTLCCLSPKLKKIVLCEP